MRTFSRAVSAGKMWQSWKVRAIPFCATTCTGSPVIFSPANMTSPAVGFSTLVIRLNTVDLPAPFGPMTARILPESRLMSTASTATSAPKRRTNPRHSSSGIGCPLAGGAWDDRLLLKARSHDAPNALRREHDEGDEDRTEDERPEVGHLRQRMLHEHEEHATDDRADQRAGAAHHHHDEDAARDKPEEQLGRREPGEASVERARQPAESVGQHDSRDLVGARIVAERDGLALVLANAGEHRAERRAHDRAAEQVGAEQTAQHEIVVADLALEPGHAERPGRPRDADDAV